MMPSDWEEILDLLRRAQMIIEINEPNLGIMGKPMQEGEFWTALMVVKAMALRKLNGSGGQEHER